MAAGARWRRILCSPAEVIALSGVSRTTAYKQILNQRNIDTGRWPEPLDTLQGPIWWYRPAIAALVELGYLTLSDGARLLVDAPAAPDDFDLGAWQAGHL